MSPDHHPPDQPDPFVDAPAEAPAAPSSLELRQRLLDLAHDVSSYLRHHHQRVVRAAAAVLLSASLAACNPFAMGSVPGLQQARPLQQEVRTGLPSAPGRYPIDPDSLGRDAQGVYHFNWLQSGTTPGSGGGSPASVSLLKLAEGSTNELELPASGDPTLRLTADTPIPLVASSAQLTPTPGTTSSSTHHHSGGVMWYPFPLGGGGTTPSYRNPPSTVQSDGTARGSSASASAPSASSRMSGLPHAVSGQSGGTGSGTAASSRSGGLGGFLGGQSGGTGSGSAVTGKSGSGGSSSGGVSGARSGGFSGGFGGGSSSSGG